MKAFHILPVLALLCACQPTPATPPVAAASSEAASFVIEDVDFDDTDIAGCSMMVERKGAVPVRFVFLSEVGSDTPHGFIRIDGNLIRLERKADTFDEAKGSGRSEFVSGDGAVTVVTDYVLGQSHEESDSAAMTGSLIVTYKGQTQTLPLSGGTAC